MCEKKNACIKVHVAESLELALARLAAAEDRTLSDYCERVLRLHVFGHGSTVQQDEKKA